MGDTQARVGFHSSRDLGIPNHVGISVVGRVPGHAKRLGVSQFQATKPPFSWACGMPSTPSSLRFRTQTPGFIPWG